MTKAIENYFAAFRASISADERLLSEYSVTYLCNFFEVNYKIQFRETKSHYLKLGRYYSIQLNCRAFFF